MSKKGILAALVIMSAAGGGYLYWQNHKGEFAKQAEEAAASQKNEAPKAPAISVTRLKTSEFVEYALVNGSLIAREEILISPEIEGFRVVELFADEGSAVKKGQVLARLVAEQLDAQMAQNEANLARSSAAIAQAKSQITEAEARKSEADAQLARAVPLKKSGYLSGSVYDQRESAARTSEAQVASARDGLLSAEASKTQVEAQIRELKWRRGNTEVKTPEDGIVSRRNARIGAVATAAGDAMFRIITKGEIELDAEVVETEIAKVRDGQKARVSVPGGAEVDGVVRLVSPEIDRTTRMGRAKIFLGAKPGLRLGAFARGTIQTASSRGIGAPTAALMFDPAGTYVQLVDGDKVHRRVVKTGLVSGDLIEITEGLKEGDTIVARAGTFLRDGDIIRPILLDEKISASAAGAK
jgi:HlyD family secretion protein